ncbi:MAG: UvrB/UvrC motif-containing protein [Patescibacteria group bacterium]
MTLEQFKKKMKKIPDAPGVYFFLAKNKKILYIGKATSLRDRVRSYFAGDLGAVRSPLITKMVERAASIDWRQTDSVLEALILEANLIKTYKPKANTDLKDDKSFNYVVITKEEYPRVLVVRGRELTSHKLKGDTFLLAHVFGPFPHGLQLQQAMKLIRKIFPYRDKCVPFSGKGTLMPRTAAKRCFNAQIGLCPGVCSGESSKEKYRRTVRHIVLLFKGKKKELIKELAREMRRAAKEENFEEAKRLRGQVFALGHIQDVSLIKDEYRSPSTGLGAIRSTRIEAYDVAHLRGGSNVGVMTVVEDDVANKNEYRKFIIRIAKGGDDVGALKEILNRRLGHDEWPMPRLIVVDGASAQINAAEKLLESLGIKIPVVGVVKDEKHRPREIRGNREVIKDRERNILLANAEAHRFAIGYHRKKLRKNLSV